MKVSRLKLFLLIQGMWWKSSLHLHLWFTEIYLHSLCLPATSEEVFRMVHCPSANTPPQNCSIRGGIQNTVVPRNTGIQRDSTYNFEPNVSLIFEGSNFKHTKMSASTCTGTWPGCLACTQRRPQDSWAWPWRTASLWRPWPSAVRAPRLASSRKDTGFRGMRW